MKTYYVWSGDVVGHEVSAPSPRVAVIEAIKARMPCLMGSTIRVSLASSGTHALDVSFYAPYEQKFPELFTGEFEYQIAHVEKEKT